MSIKQVLILFVFSLFLNCKNKESDSLVKESSNLKSKPKRENLAYKIANDTIYKDSVMIIVKSAKSIKSAESIDTLFKFNSQLDNKKFKVKVKKLKLDKELNFDKYDNKKMFITATKNGVRKSGVNFAGKFCFVYWGCGSPCQISAVVDMESGIVYNGLPSALGYEFKKDSKILIVNPPDSSGYYPKNTWVDYPTEYIWTGKKFEKLNYKIKWKQL